MKRIISFSISVLCFGFFLLSSVAAETPEEFSLRYLDSIRKNGLKGMTSFLHPDELRKLVDFVVEITDAAEKDGESGHIPFLKDGETSESLRKLAPSDVANKFLGWAGEARPQMSAMLRTAEAKLLGHVTDEEIIYVVAKLSFATDEGETITGTDVLPLRRDGDSFKMLLNVEMTGMLKAINKAVATRGKKP